MIDARGRPVEIGDWVASPDLHVESGKIKTGTILGKVTEILSGGIHLGDGTAHKGEEIITLGGYAWVVCLDCNSPWVKDKLQDECCPFCEGRRFTADMPASPQSVANCR